MASKTVGNNLSGTNNKNRKSSSSEDSSDDEDIPVKDTKTIMKAQAKTLSLKNNDLSSEESSDEGLASKNTMSNGTSKNRKSSSEDSSDDEDIPVKDTKTIMKPQTKTLSSKNKGSSSEDSSDDVLVSKKSAANVTSKSIGNNLLTTNIKNREPSSSEGSSDDEDIPVKDTKAILKPPTKKLLKDSSSEDSSADISAPKKSMAKITADISKTVGSKLSGTNIKNRKSSSSEDSSDDDIPVKDTKTILKPPTKKPLKIVLMTIFQ
ncbi:unnamed protein product [Meloidogyne enterolobii]|uniref:Uncharacterized protein n=1 Tax=Meloidogyne enterolobii TaxID=390850 RepID=A0ACB0YCU6_MELEN